MWKVGLGSLLCPHSPCIPSAFEEDLELTKSLFWIPSWGPFGLLAIWGRLLLGAPSFPRISQLARWEFDKIRRCQFGHPRRKVWPSHLPLRNWRPGQMVGRCAVHWVCMMAGPICRSTDRDSISGQATSNDQFRSMRTLSQPLLSSWKSTPETFRIEWLLAPDHAGITFKLNPDSYH